MLNRVSSNGPFSGSSIVGVAPHPDGATFAEGIALDTGFGGARELYLTVDESLWRFHIDDGEFDATPFLDAENYGYVDGDIATAETTGVRAFITYPPQGLLYFADA